MWGREWAKDDDPLTVVKSRVQSLVEKMLPSREDSPTPSEPSSVITTVIEQIPDGQPSDRNEVEVTGDKPSGIECEVVAKMAELSVNEIVVEVVVENEPNERSDDSEISDTDLATESSEDSVVDKEPKEDDNDKAECVVKEEVCEEICEKEKVEESETLRDETDQPSPPLVNESGNEQLVEILNNLQKLHTPEPHQIDDGIVRASFVDFVMDDPIEEQSDDDDADDNPEAQLMSDLNPNPELQKIREEQVRKWLIFEQENPPNKSPQPPQAKAPSPHDDTLESLTSIEADSLADGYESRERSGSGGSNSGTIDGIIDPLDLDPEHELMMNGLDGMQRRVRFLTDQEGNLLISVFMTKLVHMFLILLKVASAGYLDYLSLSATSFSHASPSNTSIPSELDTSEHNVESRPGVNFSSSSSCSSADSFILLLEPPDDNFGAAIDDNDETESVTLVHPGDEGDFFPLNRDYMTMLIPDDSTPSIPLSEEASLMSNGGTEVDPNLVQNPSLVVSPPSLTDVVTDATNDSDITSTEPSAPPMEENDEETDEEDEVEAPSIVHLGPPPLPTTAPPPRSPQPEMEIQDIQLVQKEGEPDENNSSDETLSVSSCNSMIEIIPRDQSPPVAPAEPTVIIDENNNEVKADPVVESIEPDQPEAIQPEGVQPEPVQLAPINEPLFQLEPTIPEIPEIQAEEETVHSNDSSTSSQPASLIIHELEEHSEGMADLNMGIYPTKVPTYDENNNVIDDQESIAELKFSPTISSPDMEPQMEMEAQMPELRRSSSGGSDGEYERLTPPGEQLAGPHLLHPRKLSGGDLSDDAEQHNMVSLCIQEEHISAVALTIAKWESMSKGQSTENLSQIPGPVPTPGGHTPVTKTSSSPCPKVQKQVLSQKVSAPVQSHPAVVVVQKAVGNNKDSVKKMVTVSAKNCVNTEYHPLKTKAPGWNTWGSQVKDVAKSPEKSGHDDEIIYAQPNNQAGTTMTSITNPSAILKAYPKPLSKGEIINWLKEGEIHRAGLMSTYGQSHHPAPVPAPGPNSNAPGVVNWFFGLISRQQAEKYLHGQPPGTFLVRISTRIWGYTLSYQASSQRTKHFLISAINPSVPATQTAVTDTAGHNPSLPPQTWTQQRMSPFVPQGRYAFIGTNMTPYGTLVSLIRHHSHAPITKLGGEKLVNVCPGGPQYLGLEALFK